MSRIGDLAVPDLGPKPVEGLAGAAPGGTPRPAADVLQVVHDLRQPVAVMRILLVGLAARPDLPPDVVQTLAQVNGQVIWLAELLGQCPEVLNGTTRPSTRAGAESGQDSSHLVDVLGSVVESFDAAHRGQLTCQVKDRPWVRVPVTALRRALTNLVDNAVRWAGPEGVVRVVAGVTGRRAYVVVEDDGPGFRPAPAHGAVGLGIVMEIAAAAGGSLEVGASDLGGVRAVFRVPAIRTRPE
jgi:signal transduction histidine kinase